MTTLAELNGVLHTSFDLAQDGKSIFVTQTYNVKYFKASFKAGEDPVFHGYEKTDPRSIAVFDLKYTLNIINDNIKIPDFQCKISVQDDELYRKLDPNSNAEAQLTSSFKLHLR